MAGIGTESVLGGGRYHPVINEGGAGKIVPLPFRTVGSPGDTSVKHVITDIMSNNRDKDLLL